MIRELLVERTSDNPDRPALGMLGPSHDACPADCCSYRPQRAPSRHLFQWVDCLINAHIPPSSLISRTAFRPPIIGRLNIPLCWLRNDCANHLCVPRDAVLGAKLAIELVEVLHITVAIPNLSAPWRSWRTWRFKKNDFAILLLHSRAPFLSLAHHVEW